MHPMRAPRHPTSCRHCRLPLRHVKRDAVRHEILARVLGTVDDVARARRTEDEELAFAAQSPGLAQVLRAQDPWTKFVPVDEHAVDYRVAGWVLVSA